MSKWPLSNRAKRTRGIFSSSKHRSSHQQAPRQVQGTQPWTSLSPTPGPPGRKREPGALKGTSQSISIYGTNQGMDRSLRFILIEQLAQAQTSWWENFPSQESRDLDSDNVLGQEGRPSRERFSSPSFSFLMEWCPFAAKLKMSSFGWKKQDQCFLV